MSDLSYIIVDVLCIIMLLFVFYKTLRNMPGKKSMFFYYVCIIFGILFLISDCTSNHFDANNNQPFRTLNLIGNLLYFSSSILMVYSFQLFTLESCNYFNNKEKLKIIIYILFSLPAIIFLALLYSSPSTHYIFYINDSGYYVRGNLFYLHVSVFVLYIAVATGFSINAGIKNPNPYKKKEFYTLAMFAILPLIGSIIQVINYLSQGANIGITLSVILIYMKLQEYQITLDEQTGLYNRTELMRKIDNIPYKNINEHDCYLIMCDIDKFKYINDTFGHIEGDNALNVVADVLKTISPLKKSFIGRYGGDEFIIIYRTKDPKDIETLEKAINLNIKANALNSKLKDYNLEMSFGSALVKKDVPIHFVIEEADAKMYDEKFKKYGRSRV
jgi:diguanylate cyclase (GGDEF)-like protein